MYVCHTNAVFFSIKKCTFYFKNAILCLFLKNVSPSKRVTCFILNNAHLSMVEGIAFYALYKSKILIIPCKLDDFHLFKGLPMKFKKSCLVSLGPPLMAKMWYEKQGCNSN